MCKNDLHLPFVVSNRFPGSPLSLPAPPPLSLAATGLRADYLKRVLCRLDWIANCLVCGERENIICRKNILSEIPGRSIFSGDLDVFLCLSQQSNIMTNSYLFTHHLLQSRRHPKAAVITVYMRG